MSDEFIFNQECARSRSKAHTISRYRAACELFAQSPSYEGARVCEIIAEVLRTMYKMDFDEIEEIEAAALTIEKPAGAPKGPRKHGKRLF